MKIAKKYDQKVTKKTEQYEKAVKKQKKLDEMQSNFTQKLQAMAQQTTESEEKVDVPIAKLSHAEQPPQKEEEDDKSEKKKSTSDEHVHVGQP